MSGLIHEDATSAWRYLCDHGGVELDGRDAGLDLRVHQGLDPAAPSLEHALARTSMDLFTRAFFGAMHPYVAIFKDILRFFEQAKAIQGQDQWKLRVNDIDFELEHFRQWITNWTDAATTTLTVPAIDERGAWGLWDVLRARDRISTEVDNAFENKPLNLPADVRAWVDAYSTDSYLPVPDSLVGPTCPNELTTSVSIAQAALERLLSMNLTPSGLEKLYNSPHNVIDRADALNLWTIAQSETDRWLRTFLVALSAAANHLLPSDLQDLGAELEAITGAYPTKPFDVTVSVGDLESLLSLPIWKQRYELYSVWIATEMVRALEAHEVELHHTDGCISFPFRETLVATVHSSPGPFTLISERRSPLENPRGEGRTAGVQPDHGLWTRVDGKEMCRMAVEVKHYKNSAKAKFVDIFEDYARALPAGAIYLVNHGPTGNAVYEVSRDVRERCHAIAQLAPSNLSTREEFANAVRECVGEPLVSWPDSAAIADANTALVFDVSGSMQKLLRSDAMNAFVRQLAANVLPQELIAVDTDIVGSWKANESGYSELLRIDGGGTGLARPIGELLKEYSSVVVVTDSDGLSSMQQLATTIHPTQDNAPGGIEVRVC